MVSVTPTDKQDLYLVSFKSNYGHLIGNEVTDINDASNVIAGTSANDLLIDRGTGVDTLDGGIGQDVLASVATAGQTTTYRFSDLSHSTATNPNIIGQQDLLFGFSNSVGNDKIDLSNLGITSFSDLTLNNLDIAGVPSAAGTITTISHNSSSFAFAVIGDVPTASNFIFTAVTPPAPASTPTVITPTIVLGDIFAGDVLDDTYNGRQGNDTISGGDGNDTLRGGKDQDSINGNSGADSIFGDLGNDYIRGGRDSDFLQGNAGNDTIFGDLGDDHIRGGRDNDSLNGGGGNDSIFGDVGNDTILSGSENDVIQGNAGNDVISGESGNDVLRGGRDNDILSGGDGNDSLYGDKGNDNLSGGSGADVFVFNNEAGIDVITDFNSSEGDKIHISSSIYASNIDAFNSISFAGADALLNLGGANQLTLSGITAGEIIVNDIVIV